MTNSIPNTYSYNGNEYRRRSQVEAEIGFLAAGLAAAGIKALLPPFSNPFLKQMQKEHKNNHLYKDIFEKSYEISGLKQEGLRVENCVFANEWEAKNYKKIKDGEVKAGLNAYYAHSPECNIIRINKEKSSIAGFHELGHAMNNLKSKTGKILQKMRKPGYTIAGLMGTIAILSRSKPKGSDRNLFDYIQDNCGKIAFIAMLPTVAEEALASYKGVKLAKKAGLSNELTKNLKKFYGKALLSYIGYAIITGLSVFAASKITELFTRPKKIERQYSTLNQKSQQYT